MCIIVDEDVAGSFVSDRDHQDNRPIHDWIDKCDGLIVYSQDLINKLQDAKALTRYSSYLAKRVQAGRAKFYGSEKLAPELKKLQALDVRAKDDLHILALARASGARVLYTEDQKLQSDFSEADRGIITNPKGRVYKRSEHAHVLGHDPGCPGYLSKQEKREKARRRKRRA